MSLTQESIDKYREKIALARLVAITSMKGRLIDLLNKYNESASEKAERVFYSNFHNEFIISGRAERVIGDQYSWEDTNLTERVCREIPEVCSILDFLYELREIDEFPFRINSLKAENSAKTC